MRFKKHIIVRVDLDGLSVDKVRGQIMSFLIKEMVVDTKFG